MFIFWQVLKEHFYGAHLNKCLYQCPICEKGIRTKRTYNIHVRTHQGDVFKFPCKRCNAKYDSEGALNAHMRNKHPDPTQRVQCDNCAREFAHKSTLQQHNCGLKPRVRCIYKGTFISTLPLTDACKTGVPKSCCSFTANPASAQNRKLPATRHNNLRDITLNTVVSPLP